MHELKHKIFRRKTRITGLELKYLSDAVTKIITITDLFERSKVTDMKQYVKLHGQVEDTTSHLYKTLSTEISNRIVTMDLWFEDMICVITQRIIDIE